ncbi:MAG: hypothetical protein DRP83_00660 [Planctomycetota bacterium]|nr:MAG: hypothetical protein DRP83_00660 [Planctomycetota bacterium]
MIRGYGFDMYDRDNKIFRIAAIFSSLWFLGGVFFIVVGLLAPLSVTAAMCFFCGAWCAAFSVFFVTHELRFRRKMRLRDAERMSEEWLS